MHRRWNGNGHDRGALIDFGKQPEFFYFFLYLICCYCYSLVNLKAAWNGGKSFGTQERQTNEHESEIGYLGSFRSTGYYRRWYRLCGVRQLPTGFHLRSHAVIDRRRIFQPIEHQPFHRYSYVSATVYPLPNHERGIQLIFLAMIETPDRFIRNGVDKVDHCRPPTRVQEGSWKKIATGELFSGFF